MFRAVWAPLGRSVPGGTGTAVLVQEGLRSATALRVSYPTSVWTGRAAPHHPPAAAPAPMDPWSCVTHGVMNGTTLRPSPAPRNRMGSVTKQPVTSPRDIPAHGHPQPSHGRARGVWQGAGLWAQAHLLLSCDKHLSSSSWVHLLSNLPEQKGESRACSEAILMWVLCMPSPPEAKWRGKSHKGVFR